MTFDPPTVAVAADPVTVLKINEQWLSFVSGLVARGTAPSYWETNPDDGVDGIEEILSFFGEGNAIEMKNVSAWLKLTADVTLTKNVLNVISWDAEHRSANWGVITLPAPLLFAPVGGYYAIHASVDLTQAGGGLIEYVFRSNLQGVIVKRIYAPGTGTVLDAFTTVSELATGEGVQLEIRPTIPQNPTLKFIGATISRFQLNLIAAT